MSHHKIRPEPKRTNFFTDLIRQSPGRLATPNPAGELFTNLFQSRNLAANPIAAVSILRI